MFQAFLSRTVTRCPRSWAHPWVIQCFLPNCNSSLQVAAPRSCSFPGSRLTPCLHPSPASESHGANGSSNGVNLQRSRALHARPRIPQGSSPNVAVNCASISCKHRTSTLSAISLLIRRPSTQKPKESTRPFSLWLYAKSPKTDMWGSHLLPHSCRLNFRPSFFPPRAWLLLPPGLWLRLPGQEAPASFPTDGSQKGLQILQVFHTG